MNFEFMQYESPRLRFIGKYILPLFDPAIEFFGQYGISEMTVVLVPHIIFLLICAIILRKDKFYSRGILVVIILGIVAIIRY